MPMRMKVHAESLAAAATTSRGGHARPVPTNRTRATGLAAGVAIKPMAASSTRHSVGSAPATAPHIAAPPIDETHIAETSIEEAATDSFGAVAAHEVNHLKALSEASEIAGMLASAPEATPESMNAATALARATRRAAAQGLTEAQRVQRDKVVLEHLPLVKAIAVRVHENLPVHVDVDDLVHAGILGLFDAATKYNPEKQVAFSSYAKHRIKGAILDSLRQLDWASRDMRRRHKQVEAATRELAAELQRNPTEAELAKKLGMDVERWRHMMLDLRNVGLISASTRGNENEDLPAPDFPGKPETQPDSICAHEELRGVLGEAMKTLPDRYQKVVVLYYTNEMTMKEIGGILGINESRVSQIHKSALEKMGAALGAAGIDSPQAF